MYTPKILILFHPYLCLVWKFPLVLKLGETLRQYVHVAVESKFHFRLAKNLSKFFSQNLPWDFCKEQRKVQMLQGFTRRPVPVNVPYTLLPTHMSGFCSQPVQASRPFPSCYLWLCQTDRNILFVSLYYLSNTKPRKVQVLPIHLFTLRLLLGWPRDTRGMAPLVSVWDRPCAVIRWQVTQGERRRTFWPLFH